MKRSTTACAALLLGALAAPSCARSADTGPLRFVLIPKVVHPWFDKVNDGAKAAADNLSHLTGRKVSVDYAAPQTADVAAQNDIIERSIATHPAGILLDPLDAKGNRTAMEEALQQGVGLTVFDLSLIHI